jgi:hypothetical protein
MDFCNFFFINLFPDEIGLTKKIGRPKKQNVF